MRDGTFFVCTFICGKRWVCIGLVITRCYYMDCDNRRESVKKGYGGVFA